MRKRPEDFYGPEDWYDGMDVDAEMESIRKEQAEWDAEYAALPWWKKLFA